MKRLEHRRAGSRLLVGSTLLAVGVAAAITAQARVTRIVIDSTAPLTGQTSPTRSARSRFRRARSQRSHNQIITDIQLGKDADGMVRYEATWTLTMPTDLTRRAASCGTTCRTGAARSRS